MPQDVPPAERDTRPDIHPGLRRPKLWDTQYSIVYHDDEPVTGDYDANELALLLDMSRRTDDRNDSLMRPKLELDLDETFADAGRSR